MRTANVKAAEHAATRVQFGQTLNNYQDIQEKISQMAIRHYGAEVSWIFTF